MKKCNESSNMTIASGIWYTFCNFISSSIGFLTTPIFARLLTTAEYGEFSNIQTWMMILLYIFSLNLDATLLRASYEKRDDIDAYVLSMLALAVLSTLICGVLLFLGQEYWCNMFGIELPYLLCIFAYLLFQPSISLFQAHKRFQFQYKAASFSMMFVSIGSSVLSVLFVLNWADKLWGRVIGYLLPICIMAGGLWVYYIYKGRRIYLSYWKYAIPIAIPYIPHVLSLCLLNNMDKVMIRQMRGAEEVGLYSIACTCGIILTILASSINSAFAPWLADRMNKKEYDSIYKMSYPYVLAFSALVVGIVFISPEILYILGGEEYMEAVYVIPPIAVSCLVQYAYCMYVNVEQFLKKTMTMALATSIAALSNFCLNLFFINSFGYVAAAYTTLISYLILLIIHMYFVKKIGYAKVYNNKKIVGVVFITILIVMIQNMLLGLLTVRYIVLCIYILILGVCLLKIRNRKLWDYE